MRKHMKQFNRSNLHIPNYDIRSYRSMYRALLLKTICNLHSYKTFLNIIHSKCKLKIVRLNYSQSTKMHIENYDVLISV